MSPIEIAFAVTLTLVGSIAGFYINRGLENLHLPKIGRTRRQAISGDWEGVYHQQANEKREAQEIVFRLSLKAGSRAIFAFHSKRVAAPSRAGSRFGTTQTTSSTSRALSITRGICV
jgi:hypothetical protein